MAKKKTARKKAPAKKVNKSQAIRDFMQANPTTGPTETAAALTKQGVKVSPAMVSQVKTSAKKKKKPRGRPKATRAAKSAPAKFELSALVAAKKMADQMGGLEKAQAALAALEKLQ